MGLLAVFKFYRIATGCSIVSLIWVFVFGFRVLATLAKLIQLGGWMLLNFFVVVGVLCDCYLFFVHIFEEDPTPSVV